MKKQIFTLLVGLTMMAAATTASALSTWDLNVANSNLGVSGTYATVTIDVSGNTATFNVDANNILLGSGDNFGFDKFFFNTQLLGIDISNFSFGGTDVWDVRYNNDNGGGGFGFFEIQYKGDGNDRVDPLSFTITNSNIKNDLDFYEANAEGHHFVAHIGGFSSLNGFTSVIVSDGAPVPEPGTMLLLGIGMLGMAVYGKRRMNKQV